MPKRYILIEQEEQGSGCAVVAVVTLVIVGGIASGLTWFWDNVILDGGLWITLASPALGIILPILLVLLLNKVNKRT